MKTKFYYKVEPDDLFNYKHIQSQGQGSYKTAIAGFAAGMSSLGIIISLFIWWPGVKLFVILFIIMVLVMGQFIKQDDKKARIKTAKEEAEKLSSRLNEIIARSNEIINQILPYFEASAKKSIEFAKVDFVDNALSPFWDRIEESSNFLGCYKDAVEQLIINGEIYSKILEEKKHNFPLPFPIETNISISSSILDDYNFVIRKAQTKFEFANIWEHRKTQKILIAGFSNLEQAIHRMKDEILSAISNLRYSIDSGFKELNNIQVEQLRTFENGQRVINGTLETMDKKLYYLQYRKKPNTPFIRPMID
ncbi:MAG: hypothetical protein KDC85_21885 [Saprospiraceae bacterium]|nr:hypothetical protein [Saprospiraceae bacterium]MCB9322897.1 hypothetical protein [Lewinellaceae bacterium]